LKCNRANGVQPVAYVWIAASCRRMGLAAGV